MLVWNLPFPAPLRLYPQCVHMRHSTGAHSCSLSVLTCSSVPRVPPGGNSVSLAATLCRHIGTRVHIQAHRTCPKTNTWDPLFVSLSLCLSVLSLCLISLCLLSLVFRSFLPMHMYPRCGSHTFRHGGGGRACCHRRGGCERIPGRNMCSQT